MKGMGGCLLAILGLFGIYISIIFSFTFYFLPLSFLLFIGSLILISFALGPAGEINRKKDTQKRDDKRNDPEGEDD